MIYDHVLTLMLRAKIGCVAGLVGGFAIFVSVFIIDLSLNGQPGEFYKVIGIPIGLTGIQSTLLGMILHMFTATLIGTIFGLGSSIHKTLEITSIKKGILAGVITGVTVFVVFFTPISLFLIMPAIQSNVTTDARLILSNTSLIMVGSLELHLVYGAIMGVFFALSVQYYKNKLPATIEAQ